MLDNHLKFHSTNGKRRVLIIEDEQINQEILRFMLQDLYELVFADTGTQALHILETEYKTLSMILLDLNLPDSKGVEILQQIKSDSRTAMLPVIVMTADQDAEVECLELGATDFIPKPYPKREVVQARILRTIEMFEDRDIIAWTERDQLTGLYNREFFFRYAIQFDDYHEDVPTDAIVMDINHFHMLNERYGKEFGDEALRRIAERLLEAVKGTDGIVCRQEADTFLLYCPHRSDYDDLVESACLELDNEYRIRVRMGVYSNVDREIEMERRFDRAKQAADLVKNSFMHAVGFYDEAMHEKELFAEQLLEDFHTAIRERQFAVHYQPKFDIRGTDPMLSSVEALIRWNHPKLGMISPGVFIPLFEANGLIRELDHYAWRESCAQVQKWKETLGRSIPVSVNVSRIDLYDPHLLESLEEMVQEFDLQQGELLLEVTESAYTENSEQIISVVKSLREKGFFIEMDDFGTGYSSLNMLATLPIDMLKLDMQFVRLAFRERKDTRLIEAVIGLAQSLGLPTIAEGVETAEQMFTLKAMGCDIVQGYYFTKPLPAPEFEEFVCDWDREVAETSGKTDVSRPRDQFTYDALHDPLTGLYNHSAFEILFQDADQEHIAVMIATVDGYKGMRESGGLDFAERIIKRVADVLLSNFRSADDICRLGDDEFVIIMSRMNNAMQKLVFNKIDLINAELNQEHDGLPPLSLSVGIAFSDRADPQGDVFEDAETALRRLKQIRQAGCAVY